MSLSRASGVLLHPTSLPGPYGIGQLGHAARCFVDALAGSGQTLWQVLPLNPTGYTNCPYSASSAFAISPYLIDFDGLVDEGLLTADEAAACRLPETTSVDFGAVYRQVAPTLMRAFRRFQAQGAHAEYAAFCVTHADWLEDYALFTAIKAEQGGRPWFEWPECLRSHDLEALNAWGAANGEPLAFARFQQYLAFKHWAAVKAYANARGVRLISDIPLYVAHDSADVWAHPEVFALDANRNPQEKAGVPPDCFSETGQLWGNPVYDWSYLESNRFAWWMARIRINLLQGDILRFDHFRGLESFWSVPWAAPTAIDGRWVAGPGDAFFERIEACFGHPVMISEDLGIITPEVEALRARFGLLSMKMLQFGFDDPHPENSHLPHTYPTQSVVYTSSLDSNTVRGWFEDADGGCRERVALALNADDGTVAAAMMEAAWASRAVFAIAPMQDVLGLGGAARMNLPGTVEGNWAWRMSADALAPAQFAALSALTRRHGRQGAAL